MYFEGDKIKHMQKIWHAGLAMKDLGWVERPAEALGQACGCYYFGICWRVLNRARPMSSDVGSSAQRSQQ
jgi:hypothetical protein